MVGMTPVPKIKQCIHEAHHRWSVLTEEEEKGHIERNINQCYCICKKTYSEHDSDMVGCDICGDWLHVECIDSNLEYLSLVNFHHCVGCINSNFFTFVRYCYHFNRDSLTSRDVREIGNKWRQKSPTIRSEIGSH